MKYPLFFLLLFFSACATVDAAVKLPKIFGDNMVLQRDMKVPVWGKADPGEKVTASLGGHSGVTIAGNDGRWKMYLGPLDTGGPFELKISGTNDIIFKNVLVGEVWVCSGQSNMAFELRHSLNAKEEIANADFPDIRYFQVKSNKASEPIPDVSPVSDPEHAWLNTWTICSPSTAGQLTAVGYFFGRDLYANMQVPIGLISVSWGGTTAEAWTPHEALASDPELDDILTDWPGYNDDEEWLRGEYAKYLKDAETARKNKQEMPLYFNQPSVLFNGMIAPIVPFGIRGVTWYQGESNAYRAYQYRHLFPVMIESWRKAWNQGEFPFLFVQLAGYHFEPQVFPELREAQSMALSISNTAMAVAIDIGDSADIHPKNKQEVGRRLSLAAEEMVYTQDVIGSGPEFRSLLIKDGKCYLSFGETGSGLVTGGKPPDGFVIAGADRKFVKARAEIRDNVIIVWNDNISSPVAVRYAWANYPGDANLYNSWGAYVHLPASPFRTDDWPGLTYNRTRK